MTPEIQIKDIKIVSHKTHFLPDVDFFFLKALKWTHQNGPRNLSLFIECAGFRQRGAGAVICRVATGRPFSGMGTWRAGPSLPGLGGSSLLGSSVWLGQ